MLKTTEQPKPPRSETTAVLSKSRSALIGVAFISATVNVLMLTGSVFMLQVYDRVIPSRSVPTLVGLSIFAASLFVFQGLLDSLRGRLLSRVGAIVDGQMSDRVFNILISSPLVEPSGKLGQRAAKDLDQVRAFLSSTGPVALIDLPWVPFYLAICYAFHPLIGIAATIGALLLLLVTAAAELLTKSPAEKANELSFYRGAIADASRNSSDVLKAMGFGERLAARWKAINVELLSAQRQTSDAAGLLGATSKVLRMMLQSGMLAIGAWLVIKQQASAGIIIASSIMMSRALAPVELSIANWKNFVAARQGWDRLRKLVLRFPLSQTGPLPLPAPESSISVEAATILPPGASKPSVVSANFTLSKGQGLGIIGPSASGKTSLAKALVGVWTPASGTVRLDGATFEQWSPAAIGSHIGYLPQETKLLAGTVSQNISRFEEDPSAAAVVNAAQAAGIHHMVLQLPDGYETQVGEGGQNLSAGQRQRVALARALYHEPFLVVLDEPNSNLDAEGEMSLAEAVLGVRKRGGIAVVIAHRPSALAAVCTVLMMRNGKVEAFGPKEEILAKVLRNKSPERPATAENVPSGKIKESRR